MMWRYIFLDALPANSPWWGALVAVAIPVVGGLLVAFIRARTSQQETRALRSTVNGIRAELTALHARIADIEADEPTDPDVRAERHKRMSDRIDANDRRLDDITRRVEEAGKVNAEIQRALGRIEGAVTRHER